MAISPQIVQPDNSIQNALGGLAQFLQQQGQQQQQQTNFDTQMNAQKEAQAQADRFAKAEWQRLQNEKDMELAGKRFDISTSPENRIKTYMNPAAIKMEYDSALMAGYVTPDVSLEEYKVSRKPSAKEMSVYETDSPQQQAINATIKKNENDFLVAQQKLNLQKETLDQTIKNEDETLVYKYAALGFDPTKTTQKDPNIATDHRARMDAIVKKMEDLDISTYTKDGKIKTRTGYEMNKDRENFVPLVAEYNKLAKLYGTDKLAYSVADKKVHVKGPNFKPITVGFEGKIKPLDRTPNGGESEIKVDTTPIGTLDGNPITASEYKALQQKSRVDNESFETLKRVIKTR